MTRSKLLASGVLLAVVTASACSKDNNPASSTTCSFTVGQPSLSTFPPEGGTGTSAVTAGSSCAWTAVSGASFITITQGSSGTGNGTVTFAVAANTGADRTGTLTIAGSSTTITQRAATATQTAVTLSAPTPRSPSGNQESASLRPALVVDNAVATGNAGTVTYRFEVSDVNAFPSDSTRAFSIDGIPQGNGTTSWIVDRDLAPGVHWFWRARATNGTVTSPFSSVETFTTPSACAYTLSTTNVPVNATGGTATIAVTTGTSCSWTAVSNASFVTVASGASGTGNGSVTLNVASNSGASARNGTVTIANQTVTVNQASQSLIASFRMFDPGRQTDPVTECQIRSATSVPTQCVLESTSLGTGTNVPTTFTWTVSYIYPTAKAFTQTGTNPRFSFTELCGQAGSNDSGLQTELFVTLNVVDSAGTSVTVTSNAGSQPLLTLRAYVCGI